MSKQVAKLQLGFLDEICCQTWIVINRDRCFLLCVYTYTINLITYVLYMHRVFKYTRFLMEKLLPEKCNKPYLMPRQWLHTLAVLPEQQGQVSLSSPVLQGSRVLVPDRPVSAGTATPDNHTFLSLASILPPKINPQTKNIHSLLVVSKIGHNKMSICLIWALFGSFLGYNLKQSSLYLVDTVVAVALLRSVFADASAFGAAHDSHWLSCSPVPGLCSVFVIQRCITV